MSSAADRMFNTRIPTIPEHVLHPPDLRPSRPELEIVCGPPCAGKSTYVRERAQLGDVVIDLDDILDGLTRRTGARVPGRIQGLQRALGWSEARGGPEIYRLDYPASTSDWTTRRPGSLIAPGDAELDRWMKQAGLGTLALPEAGLRIMREQRRRGFPLEEGAGGSVGAFCQMTEVRQGDIRSRIIERWPDRLGERLQASD